MSRAIELFNMNIKCERCGNEMRPVLFEEEETVVQNGNMYKTGRKRTAVSHLECTVCGKKAAIDDSFDGNWHY